MISASDPTAPPRRRTRIALVVDHGAGEPLRPLVRALGARAEVRSADRCPAPDAVLVSGPTAVDRAPEGVPRAVVDGPVVRVGDRSVTLPIEAPAGPPVPPHVRRRWRARFGLDPDLVVDVADLDPADRPTALAVAAAAVVPADDLLLALALGCPTVARRRDAVALGVTSGEVEVVDGRDPTPADARALAGDVALAARRSRLAAAFVNRRSPAVAASALLDAWGPVGPVTVPSPVDRLHARLDELGTAPGAVVRARAAAALGLFAV